MPNYPFWWLTAALLVTALLATTTATAQPVCVPLEDYVESVEKLTQCAIDRRELKECRRRDAAPLSAACTPTVVHVERPVPVVTERTRWLPVVVGVVVGFVGGAAAAWGVTK